MADRASDLAGARPRYWDACETRSLAPTTHTSSTRGKRHHDALIALTLRRSDVMFAMLYEGNLLPTTIRR